ncbi:MAG: hypothetical protein ABMA64_30350 [Myxococcota bacterium]
MITLLACAAARPLSADAVYAVSARERRGEVTLTVELVDGWHLNREYPSGFESDAGQVVDLTVDADHLGHLVAPAEAGTLHLGFCEAERCRIEHVRYPR